MKSIIIGILFTVCLYIFFSMFNHTWNMMTFSQTSIGIFGVLFFVIWGIIIVIYTENNLKN